MTKKSKTILFFGNERLATGITTTAPTFRALLESGYKIPAVISSFNSGASRNTRDLEIAVAAQSHNIPVLLPDNLTEIKQQLSDFHADIGVLAAYGKIVPQEIIDLFSHGIINIHPSLLPLHRGPTPIESAILHGETKTGVSIMQLVKAMDAGPVYAQSEIKLTGAETKETLAATLLDAGQAMLIELLPDILDGKIVPLPQDESHATYDQRIKKADGVIDWQKSAIMLEREIRAYAEWPKSRAKLAGADVIITKAHVNSEQKSSEIPGTIIVLGSKDGLNVVTSDGILAIDRLKPAGKQEMSAQAFLAGYKNRLNK